MRAMRRGISLRKEEKPETPDPVSSLFGIGNQLPTDLPNVAPTNVERQKRHNLLLKT